MTATALVLGLGMAVITSACDSSGGEDGPEQPGSAGIEAGGEPADPPGSPAIPGVRFTATLEVVDDAVHVDYVLTNDSSTEVHVPNRIGRGDAYGRITQDPNFAYATGTGDGGVTLSKRVFATPDTDQKSWAQAPTVGVSTLAPGDRLKESLVVPLPLERHQPWGNDYGFGEVSLPDPVDHVRFCLGVLPAPLPPAAALEKDDGRQVSHGNVVTEAQHVYCSEPLEL
ncbi:hypothetical protein ASG90_17430 [Nocardioides sp. Soil797]|nr:hypothetical protein ASG90_17430 [Nocardioides sp. Soil797]